MLYVRALNQDEHAELERMTKQEVGRVSERARMILLSAQRWRVPRIASAFETRCATVRLWIRRFDAGGPPALHDEPRSGRPRKATPAVEQAVVTLIQDDPQESGYLATFWTVAMLLLAVFRKVGVALSPSAMRATLHRVDLRSGRPRLAMPLKVDPQKARKQWAIAKAVVEASADTAILYCDESRIELLPLLRRMWHWVGHQLRIPTPGTNDTRTIFGALNIYTGRWVYQIRERAAKEDFVAFLEHLLVAYANGPILLIADNFSSHKAKVVREWLAEHPHLQLHFLPTYCSHLNPVEPIWLRLKGKIAANRLYVSMELLLATVHEFFEQMLPRDALIWSGCEEDLAWAA